MSSPPPSTRAHALAGAERLHGLRWVGEGLARPECVLATAQGDLYCADWRGGVSHVLPDGSQRQYLSPGVDGVALRPNGIALRADGSFLIAHLGEREGGVFALQRDGEAEPWLLAADGLALPPTNYVLPDAAGRTWITVSTRHKPRAEAYRSDVADGFIVCVRPDGGAQIVADGLGYTNEVALHPSGRWLYAVETFARRISRFALQTPDGQLGERETFCTLGHGCFPDGMAFDESGALWVVSIVSNRLLRIGPDGAAQVWLEDSVAEHLDAVEAAYAGHRMGRPQLDQQPAALLRQISSIAFAGPDRRQAVLGCLHGDRLAVLDMPCAGLAPVHWEYR